jgi:hypothetical protein
LGKLLEEAMRILFTIILLLIGSSVFAQNWYEPKRGTDTRLALMDAIRPHVEWQLGKPIQFVVDDLRVSGDVAFAALSPQRPGGGKIDLFQTPAFKRGLIQPDFMDGTAVGVLYRKLRKTWVAVHHSIGATDVWYSDYVFCLEYGAVIPEWCS